MPSKGGRILGLSYHSYTYILDPMTFTLHLLFYSTPNSLQVSVGEHDLEADDGEIIADVVEIILHEDFR